MNFVLNDLSGVGEARRFAQTLCDAMEFGETEAGRVGIIVNELGNNLVKYAPGGRLVFTKLGAVGDGLEILALDKGPGFDLATSLHDGYSTGSTPGTGMGAVRRQADEFDAYSQRGNGSVVMARVYARTKTAPARYDVAAVGWPMKGEKVSGDGWASVIEKDQLHVLVVDGLGHGPSANKSALEATEGFLESYQESLEREMQVIHGRMKATRGGAVFLIRAHDGTVEFTGVGNIRALLQAPTRTKTLISHNGTAGVQMRAVKPLSETWDQGSYLILHSDGILNRFNLLDYPGLLVKHPAVIAGLVIRDFVRGTDDATVMVVRQAK